MMRRVKPVEAEKVEDATAVKEEVLAEREEVQIVDEEQHVMAKWQF